jgi:hypothetical protein
MTLLRFRAASTASNPWITWHGAQGMKYKSGGAVPRTE